jgi:hypothetical protein
MQRTTFYFYHDILNHWVIAAFAVQLLNVDPEMENISNKPTELHYF